MPTEFKKFSLPKLIHICISLLVAIGGLVFTIIFILKENKTDAQTLLIYLGVFITIFGVVFLVNAFLLKDKHYKLDNHTIRCYNGLGTMIIDIDGDVVKKNAILTVKSKDLYHEKEGVKVRLHVNGWGAVTIFINDKKL